jgi:hypothetical protein
MLDKRLKQDLVFFAKATRNFYTLCHGINSRMIFPKKVVTLIGKLSFDWHFTNLFSDQLRIKSEECLFRFPSSVVSHLFQKQGRNGVHIDLQEHQIQISSNNQGSHKVIKPKILIHYFVVLSLNNYPDR